MCKKEIKSGVQNFSRILYETKLQEQLAERRGIKFGVRSKSWTHFLTLDEFAWSTFPFYRVLGISTQNRIATFNYRH